MKTAFWTHVAAASIGTTFPAVGGTDRKAGGKGNRTPEGIISQSLDAILRPQLGIGDRAKERRGGVSPKRLGW